MGKGYGGCLGEVNVFVVVMGPCSTYLEPSYVFFRQQVCTIDLMLLRHTTIMCFRLLVTSCLHHIAAPCTSHDQMLECSPNDFMGIIL